MTVNYTNFFAQVIEIDKVFTEDDIMNAFKYIDRGDKGFIIEDDLKSYYNRKGLRDAGEEEIKNQIKDIPKKSNIITKDTATTDNPSLILTHKKGKYFHKFLFWDRQV